MTGPSRLQGSSGSVVCPHVFGRGSCVAGTRGLRSGEIFERNLRPRIRRIHVTCSAATGADFSP
jgi:hypothetical protein